MLRELSKDAGMQFQGLQQAARFYRLKKRLGNNMVKKLANLDVAFNIMRHLTKPGHQEFACGIFSLRSRRAPPRTRRMSGTSGTRRPST